MNDTIEIKTDDTQCEYCGEWGASECVFEGRNLCPDCESVWYELDDMEATQFDASIYGQ